MARMTFPSGKRANRKTACCGPDYLRTEGHRRAVGSASCLLAVLNALCGHNWPAVAGLEQLASRALGPGGAWGLERSGPMYLCGSSVLACWAGKAVLILILLSPSIFGARRECPQHCCTMPKWYAVVIPSSLRTAVQVTPVPLRFPGVAPWGPAQLLSPSGRYVFAWWLLRASPSVLLARSTAPIRLSRSRHLGHR